MIPTVAEIMRRRHTVQSWSRAVALLLILVGAVFAARMIGQQVWGRVTLAGQTPYLYDLMHGLISTGSFLIPGVVLYFLSRLVSRLVVPFPKPACPRCGYSIFRLREARCPECGLPLPPELLDNSAASAAPVSAPRHSH